MDIINIKTNNREEFIDITSEIEKFINKKDIKDGILILYNPHTTAGLTINEGADPSVKRDILYKLSKLIPYKDNYTHLEGNSDAHIKATLIGSSLNIIIKDKRMQLGTWQSIYFAEFDGPRHRKIFIDYIEK